MKTRDGSDQAEPETVSGRVAAVFEAIKALEDMLVFAGGNPGPVIGDRDDRTTVDVFVGDHDPPCGGPMLDRVVHELGYRVKYQITIAGHQHLPIDGTAVARSVLSGLAVVHIQTIT